MARTSYDDVVLHCLICTTPVPPERLRFKAITCSEECAILRKNMIRAKHDGSACRYCRKPSTNEQRAAFQRFRKIEKKQPELLYPEDYKAWIEEQQRPVNNPAGEPVNMSPAKFLAWLNDRDTAQEAAVHG